MNQDPKTNAAPARPLESFVRGFGSLLARCIYRVTTHGQDKLPRTGGVLLLPNHLTWVDAIVLQLACPRPIRFVIYDDIYRQPLLNPLFRLIQAIPISSRKAKEAVREAARRIEQGEVVCVFPEGELSRSGMLLRLKKGYELIARQANAPVLPVWLDKLWGSIFSFYGGRFFSKWPREFPYRVSVAFGEPLDADQADIATVRQKLLELGEFCFDRRPFLRGHIGEAALRGLKRRQFSVATIDGMDHSTLKRGDMLAAGLALSRHLRKTCRALRLAILLPPGKGGIVANLGVMLADKVPVNLNFTAGRDANESAIRRAEIDTVLTAKIVQKKVQDFPWPETVVHVESLLPSLKKQIILWRVLVFLLPAWLLARIAGVSGTNGKREGVLLFTSGSSGEPKGVVLSHRNILANVAQCAAMLNLHEEDTVLASLPLFHSFGSTVTLWYPLIEGVRAVTYPTPLEVHKNADLIERYRVTLMVSTPTFLRAYIRKVEPSKIASVQMLVTGAEKLPRELAAAFREKFDKRILEGYGLTETSPVASVNLPEPPSRPGDSVQPSSRDGSVGKLAAGMAARIRNPETDAELSLHDTGMLWLRGPNIFEGYLGDRAHTDEVVRDGWFRTGDLGRFDEDGFLYIEGRLSRFSKIGGEMVPHETVEQKIQEILALSSESRAFAVMGIPDEAKGEALVLLAAAEINTTALRTRLAEAGLPNLWIPRIVRPVEHIPVLASGKLDLRACKELALAAAGEQ